jgi:hypothetical protein
MIDRILRAGAGSEGRDPVAKDPTKRTWWRAPTFT